jgi:hypothetical protein
MPIEQNLLFEEEIRIVLVQGLSSYPSKIQKGKISGRKSLWLLTKFDWKR